MERVTDELLGIFRRKGVARLDETSLELAVAMACDAWAGEHG